MQSPQQSQSPSRPRSRSRLRSPSAHYDLTSADAGDGDVSDACTNAAVTAAVESTLVVHTMLAPTPPGSARRSLRDVSLSELAAAQAASTRSHARSLSPSYSQRAALSAVGGAAAAPVRRVFVGPPGAATLVTMDPADSRSMSPARGTHGRPGWASGPPTPAAAAAAAAAATATMGSSSARARSRSSSRERSYGAAASARVGGGVNDTGEKGYLKTTSALRTRAEENVALIEDMKRREAKRITSSSRRSQSPATAAAHGHSQQMAVTAASNRTGTPLKQQQPMYWW